VDRSFGLIPVAAETKADIPRPIRLQDI
jgi:hypothetical protein